MRVVVIGGDAAGMSCASQVKRQMPGAEVVVYEKGDWVSYAACGMPYYIGGAVAELDDLVAVTAEDFRKKRHIDLKLGYEATSIDVAEKTVSVRAPDGTVADQPYDRLMIATGARPIVPPFEGVALDGVFTLHSLDESALIRKYIEERDPATVAVIGGGYIGLELAEAMRAQGLEVALFEMLPRVIATYEPEISTLAQSKLKEEGVRLRLECPVRKFKPSADGQRTTIVTDCGEYAADLVVLGLGVKPNSELAREAGIECGVADAICVNDRLETSEPDIYAAGDCAEMEHIVSGKGVYIPLALNANRMGMYAGLNIAGYNTQFAGTLGSAVLKCFDLTIARTGLGFEEAIDAGFDCARSVITARSRAHYYPGAKPITVVSIFEQRTGRLLGLQMAGEDRVAARINIAATAIQNGMTVNEMLDLDLAYAPPFGPVWDPLLIAARVARKKVGGE